LEKTSSDYVEFSNFNIHLIDRKMKRLCGAKDQHFVKTVVSDGSFFRVTFRSNDVYEATGFQAVYQFKTFVEGTFTIPPPLLERHSIDEPKPLITATSIKGRDGSLGPRCPLSFRTPSSEVTARNSDFCHVFEHQPDMKMLIQNSENVGPKTAYFFVCIYYDIET